jgi:hypothetical protein
MSPVNQYNMGPITSSRSRYLWLTTQRKSPTIYRLEISLMDPATTTSSLQAEPRARIFLAQAATIMGSGTLAQSMRRHSTQACIDMNIHWPRPRCPLLVAVTVRLSRHQYRAEVAHRLRRSIIAACISISTIYHRCRLLAPQLYNNNTKHYTYITPVSNTNGRHKPITLGNDPSSGSPTETLL